MVERRTLPFDLLTPILGHGVHFLYINLYQLSRKGFLFDQYCLFSNSFSTLCCINYIGFLGYDNFFFVSVNITKTFFRRFAPVTVSVWSWKFPIGAEAHLGVRWLGGSKTAVAEGGGFAVENFRPKIPIQPTGLCVKSNFQEGKIWMIAKLWWTVEISNINKNW